MEPKIRDEFAVHILNESGIEQAKEVARLFSNLLSNLEAVIGADGREIAIVRTKLQEAAFFAKRGLAVRPQNLAPGKE